MKEEKRWSKRYKDSCLELGWPKLENQRSTWALAELYQIVNNKSCLNFKDYYCWKPISSLGHINGSFCACNLGLTCFIHFLLMLFIYGINYPQM